MSEVLKSIRERSSIRKYKQETLPEDIIEKLVHAGLQAPTARNEQEVHFSVVKKRASGFGRVRCTEEESDCGVFG